MQPVFYHYWTYFDLFFSTSTAQYNQSLVCSIRCHYALSWVFCSYFFSVLITSPFSSCVLKRLLDLPFGSRICLHSFVLNYVFFYFVFKPSHLNYLNVSVSSKGCLLSFLILLFNFLVLVIVQPIVNLIWIFFIQFDSWCIVLQMHFWEFLSCFFPIPGSKQNE